MTLTVLLCTQNIRTNQKSRLGRHLTLPRLPPPFASLSLFIHTPMTTILPYQSPISKFIRPPVVYVRIPISGYSVIGITDPTYMLQPLYCAIAVYASMYICVFIAYDWMSWRMRTYAHS